MSKGPKLSLILPIYNVENYIGQCLDSIIKQTLIDIEIICVDDGTKDGSCAVVEQFQKIDNRIKLVHKKNGGLASARNEGLRHAAGDYVWFIDSDDYIAADACEILYGEMLEHEPEIIVFGAHAVPENRADKWTIRNLSPGYYCCTSKGKKPNKTGAYDKSMEALVFFNGAYPFVWRNAYKREFLLKNKFLFDESVKFGEDTVFMFEAFPCAEQITFLEAKLYYYRCARVGSLMHQYKDQYVRLTENIGIAEIVLKHWKKMHWLENYGKEALSWYVDFLGYGIGLYDGDASKKADLKKKARKQLERYELLGSKNKLNMRRKSVLRKAI